MLILKIGFMMAILHLLIYIFSQEERGDTIAFNDSTFVGPNKFYSVYTLKPYNGGSINTAYYNTSKGLLGFKTEEGLLWYLKN